MGRRPSVPLRSSAVLLSSGAVNVPGTGRQIRRESRPFLLCRKERDGERPLDRRIVAAGLALPGPAPARGRLGPVRAPLSSRDLRLVPEVGAAPADRRGADPGRPAEALAEVRPEVLRPPARRLPPLAQGGREQRPDRPPPPPAPPARPRPRRRHRPP